MNRIYNMSHSLIASILLFGLFLQGCGGQNQFVPQEKKSIKKVAGSGKQILPKELEGQELRISGGNLITLYEEDGELQADVRVNEIQPKSNYKCVPVLVEGGQT